MTVDSKHKGKNVSKAFEAEGFGIVNWNSQFRRAGQKYPRDRATAEITRCDSTQLLLGVLEVVWGC